MIKACGQGAEVGGQIICSWEPLKLSIFVTHLLLICFIRIVNKCWCVGCRRGAAWGLAGLVKGLGIGSLKNLGILERIKGATEDQVSPAFSMFATLFACVSWSVC